LKKQIPISCSDAMKKLLISLSLFLVDVAAGEIHRRWSQHARRGRRQKNDVEVKRYPAATATTILAATDCGSPERASNAATSAVRRMTFWVSHDIVRNNGLRCFPRAADEGMLHQSLNPKNPS
jgi:hypothetical protein